MGKMGQPTDRDAMEAKRIMAVRLLNQGLAPSIVRQQLSVSKTWIYKVRQEAMLQATTWDGVERRRADRRQDRTRPIAPGVQAERRSGSDRRKSSPQE